jgi:hypothetical protein
MTIAACVPSSDALVVDRYWLSKLARHFVFCGVLSELLFDSLWTVQQLAVSGILRHKYDYVPQRWAIAGYHEAVDSGVIVGWTV